MNKVFVKGMVCGRCIDAVKTELGSAGIALEQIALGELTLPASTAHSDHSLIAEKLAPLGFTLLEDKRTRIVKEVKALVAEVYSGDFDFPHRFRFSELLAQRTGRDYDLMSSQFSLSENTTIEKYLIDYRIGKVKEFLVYSGDALSDIAFKLGFSSVAHLSRQFRQQTGMNPSQFRLLHDGHPASYHH